MEKKNRHDLPGLPATHSATLFVVSTPIGNLNDLSPRARLALERCHTILCEDTRQTAKLLGALKIPKSMSRLERLDAHTPQGKLGSWIERLKKGESLALVSDAGTPAVSDPGTALVALARESGLDVVPIPGPSAVLALLSASGLETSSFTFRGFFPRKSGDRQKEVERCARSGLGGAFVWFESPQRVVEALESLAEHYADASVVAAKELTKLYEKFFSGPAIQVVREVQSEIHEQGMVGEWCFAVVFPEVEKSSDWVKALHSLLDAGISASEAARRVSQSFGAPKKAVYDEALKISGKKTREGG